METAAEVWFWIGPKATGTARFGCETQRHGAYYRRRLSHRPLRILSVGHPPSLMPRCAHGRVTAARDPEMWDRGPQPLPSLLRGSSPVVSSYLQATPTGMYGPEKVGPCFAVTT